MLTSVLKYAYPQARIRALKGALLTADDFAALLAADTYPAFLRHLQATTYAKALSETDESPLTIPGLTAVLHTTLFQDYEKAIQALAAGPVRQFFVLLYQKYDLINLKTILRGICNEVPEEIVAPLLLPKDRYTLFSRHAVLKLRKVMDVVEYFRNTFFEYPLQRALYRFDKEREFFPLEMALDLHYYHTLWETALKLPQDEQTIVRELLGMTTDVLNVSWIIRFKEQYHFSPEEILNYLIHHGHAFNLKDRRELAEARDAAAILTHLQQTRYKKAIRGDESLDTLHIVLTRYVVSQIHKYFLGDPFQIGVILGYLLLKEYEISDLTTIAEAKKYGFSHEQTVRYVIHR